MRVESGMLVIAITGEQIRAARALTRLEQRELAERASVSVETIKRLERIRGAVDANIRTLTAMGPGGLFRPVSARLILFLSHCGS